MPQLRMSALQLASYTTGIVRVPHARRACAAPITLRSSPPKYLRRHFSTATKARRRSVPTEHGRGWRLKSALERNSPRREI
ncbi:MAG: hypothetical protein JWN44_5783 [Myxococcales bacterium]|nr:hypothetical protein [Myxococcales bacterium]